MPIKRYCELCKAELPPGVLSFGFELHVKTVGKEAELKKLVTISGEYCTKCTTEVPRTIILSKLSLTGLQLRLIEIIRRLCQRRLQFHRERPNGTAIR
jgi:hypothetical protein